MKRLMRSLLFLLLLTGSAYAQLLNLPKGKTFEITNSHTQTGTFNNAESFTYSFKSLGKDSRGNFVLEARMVHADAKDLVDQQFGMNTDSVKKTKLNSTGHLFPLAMLNKPFTVVLSPEGKMTSINGVKEILTAAMNKWGIKSDTQKQLLANAATFGPTIERLFYQKDVAKKPLTAKLQVKNIDVPFTSTDKTSNTLTLESSKIVDDIKVEDKYVVDLKSGLIISGLSNSESVIGTKALDPGAKKVQVKATTIQSLGPVKKRQVPDTSWIDYAVRLSYWSEAYTKNGDYDSTKVYPLLEVKDPTLLNDPYFIVRRLNAVQGVDGDRAYELYKKLLVSAPNKYLEAESSHLHNKLGESLEELGADSAYEVSKYAIKTDAMNRWTQHSFAQAFLGSPGDDKEQIERLSKSYKLLDLLKADKNAAFQQLVTPLYLWANSLRNPNDLDGLKRAGVLLAGMNDEDMKKGNGGRYALLTYQRLLAAKQDKEATTLLDTTIQKLARYTADTLNKERFAHQSMLAGAYYMKSAALSAASDPGSISYLVKAANYSPKDSKEKAYISFYDRVFLKTKESYKEDYLNAMLSSGNEAEALRIFAENINAMPENIGEMRKLFLEKFPGKDFKAFFNDNIVSTWASAPSFKVKGIDGKDHTINDYKDKWLIMDFWGTWCGPCKEEMPVVNKFGEEVAAGKYPNVSFLSVACYDTESKVKSYLTANNFSLPAAISDGQIEKAYKIAGYPSKIIISPKGKMINVGFGKDWQAVIKSFSAL
jgi:thiol-disulfide isomerase/thioredoxin